MQEKCWENEKKNKNIVVKRLLKRVKWLRQDTKGENKHL